jgi:regulatory protein
MSFETPSLKGRALRLLSGREHSRLELERKLVQFEEEPGSLAVALDDLQAKGFISEQRVLESVGTRRAAKLGAARIKQELQQKGITPEAINEVMAGLQETELARARAIWQRRFGKPPVDAKEHAKQSRFLMARGFSGAVVGRLLRAPDEV